MDYQAKINKVLCWSFKKVSLQRCNDSVITQRILRCRQLD